MFGYSNALYYQIAEDIVNDIVEGETIPGSKLKTVRDLAQEKKVNPQTIQKAYKLLEDEEIVHSIGGSGKYVTEDVAKLEELKKSILNETINDAITKLKSLGYSKEDIIKYIEEMNE